MLWQMLECSGKDFFFPLWLHPWHMKVPKPGIESEPQLWQRQIL